MGGTEDRHDLHPRRGIFLRNFTPKNSYEVVVDEEFGITEAEVQIDNGDFGSRTIRFETGQLARQADGSVTTYLDDDTMMLSTVTASNQPREGFDFFPLTVDVEERMYAAGKIPGSFFRREGRPSTEAILACRLIDRPLRPTFVKGLRNEVQVVVTVMSMNPEEYYDVVAINGASAATQLSGLPVSGPVGGVRMALIADDKHPEGQWVAFPNHAQHERALFEMVVAGRIVERKRGRKTEQDVAIMMVEAGAGANVVQLVADGAPAPTEATVAEGLEAAKPYIKTLCEAQHALADQCAAGEKEFPLFPAYSDKVYSEVEKKAAKKLAKIMTIAGKAEREDASNAYMEEIEDDLMDKFDIDDDEADERSAASKEIRAAYNAVMKNIVREKILTEGFRIDGRGITDIRDLEVEVELIPRAHGSALFERGETQILGVTTLDMLKMEQQIDSLTPETSKRYIHHYNFPPYSTGETGRVGSPKRREIGHGALAERALTPVIPSREEFPYTIRQVSEALGSNGSTSMGSVCASTLSLYNAGVPLAAPVAGIAMGLVSGEVNGETEYVALTDILGAEDAFGDMDFKVAGTREFITALQLDTKLDGIPSDVLANALEQARDAREAILDTMAEVIEGPDEMSPLAPKITTVTVPVSKIGEVIGPKGKTINQITEDTGAEVTIEDDGTIYVSATQGSAADAAIEKINAIANPQMPKVGERYLGTVVKTVAFGAFVSILPGTDGLIHISNLGGNTRIENVEDVINVGDKVEVEIRDIDNRGKISLVPVEDGA
ncbi:Polyribonucleotide nucleotidyltransferase [Corynebacterium glaucum]|uniref:Polyribonucleotide nucleotidyltransferase n=1 Tax=Corynebacterium glaucum TaxID=187491 RepID=A0A1Q2HXJ0_9CORY|nr:polyribonucleotide nucleotidyltransferase [Corynebacterium glaucum]AQQ15490.1 Polyribonucleotide nucleotidyltransferase [Corynebacterium glaucum]WJZ07992.1 Polyribonucleotide nucleotidyltransferase [Corynebacterium glaucum]